MKTTKVFVYGTLIVGESNHRVAEPFLVSHEEGIVKGHLYSCGGFPAIVLDDINGRDIKGQWFTIKEEGLENMDRLEGYHPNSRYNMYDRVHVKDSQNDNEGFIYVFTKEKVEDRDLPLIVCGSWVQFNNARKRPATF